MKTQTKNKLFSVIILSFFVVCTAFLSSCNTQKSADDLWQNAVYTEDKTFGEGAKIAYVEVIAGDKGVTFTLKTDKENLADALLEYSLVEGDDSEFGLYIKKVNGIVADYDVDKAYWSLTKDGEAHMSGASDTIISDGDKYEFTYTK